MDSGAGRAAETDPPEGDPAADKWDFDDTPGSFVISRALEDFSDAQTQATIAAHQDEVWTELNELLKVAYGLDSTEADFERAIDYCQSVNL